jgi:hypothetical protein
MLFVQPNRSSCEMQFKQDCNNIMQFEICLAKKIVFLQTSVNYDIILLTSVREVIISADERL